MKQRSSMTRAGKYIMKKKDYRRWQKIAAGLAAVVVFITVYLLILPAVTMERSNPTLEAEQTTGRPGTSMTVTVHAAANEDMEETVFFLSADSDNIRLSDACVFGENETAQITDEAGRVLDLHQESGKDGTAGYWFSLRAEDGSSDLKLSWVNDTEEAGTLVLSAGNGATLEDAKNNAAENTEDALTLSWTTEESAADQVKKDPDTQKENIAAEPAENSEGDGGETRNGQNDRASQPAVQSENDTYIDGGTIDGTEITWAYTEDTEGNRTLTISGEGGIPDFSSASATPWYNYIFGERDFTVVVEEGITEIGNNAFNNSYAVSYQLSDTITRIGTSAFAYNRQLTSIDIPGSVTAIEGSAFAGSSALADMTLHEGLKTVGINAFNFTVIRELNLPASLQSVNSGFGQMRSLQTVTVAEGSQYMTVEDNVLFQKTEDDTWGLLVYPACCQGSSYEVPEEIDGVQVTEIMRGFSGTQYVRTLTIPDTVGSIYGYSFQNSSVTQVIVESTALTNSNYAFISCSNLTQIDISHLAGTLPSSFFSTCTGLTTISIPEGITRIGGSCFTGCTGLEEVIYDAADATWDVRYNPMGTSSMPRYDLVIGEHVDVLDEVFYQMAERAETITFRGPNQITVAEGALAGAPSPFDRLSGDIYIDENGLVYTYDADSEEATLIYCPSGIREITVPSSIEPESGVTCAVTGVAADALKHAVGLTGITFEDPGRITSLEAYALANCPTLTSVNGQTTAEGAENSFENAEIGYNVFYNTGLAGASGSGSFAEEMNGSDSLVTETQGASDMSITVGSSGGTLEWLPEEGADTGGYRLLTGDTMNLTVSVGNTEGDENYAYRVYLSLTDEDGSLNITPGQTYTFDGQEAVCYGTEDPYTVYLEFTPTTGATVSIPVTASYPSPSSDGGGVTVWGVILTKENAEETAGTRVEPQSDANTIQAYWTTEEDDFRITKDVIAGGSVSVVGDGQGGALPGDNLSWQIALGRAEDETLSYGKDYVRSIEYADTLTLPEGVSWNENVLQEIHAGNVWRQGDDIYAGDTRVAVLRFAQTQNSLRLGGVRIALDDSGNPVLYWQLFNLTEDAEISSNTLNFYILPAALSVDMEVFDTAGETVTNTVTAQVHYNYSEDAKLEDSADLTLSGGTGSVRLNKQGTSAVYFGEDVTYTLTLSNPGGLPWTGQGEHVLRDILSPYTYISPENMERMFEEEYGDRLTVTIEGASLAAWNEVTAADGEASSWQHSGNTDMENTVSGQTLTVTRNTSGTGYLVEVAGGGTYTGETVAQALQDAGYAVTSGSQYTCLWDTSGADGNLTLGGGESRTYMIYATAKDTFQMLGADWPGQYPVENTVSLQNTASLLNPDGGSVQTGGGNTATTSVRREAAVAKSVYRDGESLNGSFDVEDRDVLEYRLLFTHYGTGSYEDLPMVDDMYGTQYLLVPVSGNDTLAGLGLETVTDEGENYYVLTEGSYENVTVGTDPSTGEVLTAASVTVTPAEKESQVTVGDETQSYVGCHTRIKWYFDALDGGNYQMEFRYKAVADMDLAQGGSYTIGNVVWMNDKTGSRIYDSLWGSGTIIDYAKDIVLERDEDIPMNDTLAEDAYSLIGPGDQVTYRLTLRNRGEGTYALHGNELADALPDTFGVFTWEKDVNVTDFDYEIVGGTTTVAGLENWYLGDSYGGLVGDRQYILWPGTTEINFEGPSTLYIYVTLTYPKNTDEGENWSRYAAAAQGNPLNNTLYVYRFPSVVTHDLRETGEVMLQKGVYGTSRYSGTNPASITYTATSSRLYYNNQDSQNRAVTYYVTLYNGGNKRMYLNTLYDSLPEGFTYLTMVPDGSYTETGRIDFSQSTSITTAGGVSQGDYPLVDMSRLQETGENVIYRSARIMASTSDGGLRFTISSGSGEYTVKYDEERRQYYLDKGEAIVFGYLCRIGTSEETRTSAENVIAMPYTDQLGTGLEIVDKNTVYAGAPVTEFYVEQNDGERGSSTAADIEQNYGFTDSGQDASWLVSRVTVRRGGIIPGVTKYTDSYTTEQGGQTQSYENTVGPNDTVHWRVRLHNSGTLAITDYTLTDVMPSPFSFTGTVGYTVYDGTGTALSAADMFTIERMAGSDNITIRFGNATRSFTFDGEYQDIPYTSGISVSLAFDRDENKNEVMYLRFGNAQFSIPEGGYVDVTVSSRNMTNDYQNTVYTNQALLTPNVQEFDAVSQGSMVRDEDGTPVSVQNASPVNVSFGFATSSEKRVQEAAAPENSAVSTDPENNYILLPGADSTFRYTLTVENSTDEAMTRLVLIDNLPEEGDHSPFDTEAPRNSAFAVRLAENPAFAVTVTGENGVQTVLSEEQYTIQYSTDTDFGGAQSADWRGENTGTAADWTQNPEGARSVRIIIDDGTGLVIPGGSTISVSFTAEIDGNADPGAIAWNSFGYHYQLLGVPVELEAMPLNVGIKVPSVPELVKRTVDADGEPAPLDEARQFTFVVYTGNRIPESWQTLDELHAILNQNNRQYRDFAVTVEAGESVSEAVSLAAEGWTWTEGTAYTIVEVPAGDEFELDGFNQTNQQSYTFLYDPDVQVNITCQNELLRWSIDLVKQDGTGDGAGTLAGAVFALYSPDESDAAEEIPEGYEDLEIETSFTADSGQTWYLTEVGTTGEDGSLSWSGLLRERYYLLEVKAPDGYNLNAVPWQILERTGAGGGAFSLTVVNEAGYELPKTGGPGTTLYTTGGLALLAAALMYGYRKRGKEGSTR